MHFHLPTYLPYYPENDPETGTDLDQGKDNVQEIEMTEELIHPSFMSVVLVLSAAVGLVFMVALYA